MTAFFDSDEFNRSLFFPRRDTSAPPAGASDSYVAVRGGRLHLRKHAASRSSLTVLLFHGNGEVVSDYDQPAEDFAAVGAALAVVDYRGYGQSEGVATLRNLIEDSRKVVAALSEAPLVIMGRSLGSMAAAELYRDPPPGIVGFIWESGLVDLDALVRRRGLDRQPEISEGERRQFETVPKLRAGRLPILLLHGADDDLIDPWEAQVAFDMAGTTTKQLVLLQGRGHNDLSAEPAYWQAIATFLRQVAASPLPPA